MRLAARLALAAALAACGEAGGPPPQGPPPPEGPVSEVARYLPFTDNHVYAYRTQDRVKGTSGALMLRVRRRAIGGVELLGGARTQRVVADEDGIKRDPEGTYMLRTPVAVGTSWRTGLTSTARIAAVDRPVKVPAGSFDRCVVVVEERGGPAVRGKITTTFCLDVGIVSIETEGEGGENAEPISERVELKSFGPAVDLNAPPPR
ncbi:MAG TPA: hypothetical protein VFS43_47545 [Polyangiaceae bacterium]|nr:hypothetical protein [Polyangiaceae bacterium]